MEMNPTEMLLAQADAIRGDVTRAAVRALVQMIADRQHWHAEYRTRAHDEIVGARVIVAAVTNTHPDLWRRRAERLAAAPRSKREREQWVESATDLMMGWGDEQPAA